jgi:hypothetical protein
MARSPDGQRFQTYLLTAVQQSTYGRAMSPSFAPARMCLNPVITGCVTLRIDSIATTTTTTITTGSGWVSVRE